MINIHQKDEHTTIHPSKHSDATGAVADNGVPMVVSMPLSQPSKSDQPKADGRWCDGDKAIPLKKRKASFQMNGMVVDVTGEYSNKMKSKTNKNCPLQEDTQKADDDDDDDYYEEDDNDSDSEKDNNKRRRKSKCKKSSSSMGATANTKMTKTKTTKTKTKKKRGGGVIMEGSRCSRVNGRGWRCMQPTLVGYSLCEHHLGKGRLRSMSSVRARSTNTSTTSTTLLSQLPPPRPLDHDDHKKCSDIAEAPKQEESMTRVFDDDDNDDDDYDYVEQRPPICAGNGRKRTRIGMVKARSLSSLLCLPDTTTTTTIT